MEVSACVSTVRITTGNVLLGKHTLKENRSASPVQHYSQSVLTPTHHDPHSDTNMTILSNKHHVQMNMTPLYELKEPQAHHIYESDANNRPSDWNLEYNPYIKLI